MIKQIPFVDRRGRFSWGLDPISLKEPINHFFIIEEVVDFSFSPTLIMKPNFLKISKK